MDYPLAEQAKHKGSVQSASLPSEELGDDRFSLLDYEEDRDGCECLSAMNNM